MISWYAVSAVCTAMTTVVFAVTAIFGFNQLRQLRRATQLDGAMRVLSDLNSPPYIEARQFVATELQKSLKDPSFRKEVELGAIWTGSHATLHHEQVILRTFEAIGVIVQEGLLEPDVVTGMAGVAILLAWEHLSEIVDIQRRTIHPRMWESFEFLHGRAEVWFIERGGEEQYRAWQETVARYRAEISQTARSPLPPNT
jgi:hypothetical protein